MVRAGITELSERPRRVCASLESLAIPSNDAFSPKSANRNNSVRFASALLPVVVVVVLGMG